MRHGEITYQATFEGLMRLHGELGGKIMENKRAGEQLAEQMRCVETVIKMIRPDFNMKSIAVRRRYKRFAPYKRGTGAREIINVLRGAAGPMTSMEVATAIIRKHGAEPILATKKDRDHARAAVHTSLKNYERKGLVEGTGHHPVRWRLKMP